MTSATTRYSWSQKLRRAWKRLKIVIRIDSATDSDWLAFHPDYVPKVG